MVSRTRAFVHRETVVVDSRNTVHRVELAKLGGLRFASHRISWYELKWDAILRTKTHNRIHISRDGSTVKL